MLNLFKAFYTLILSSTLSFTQNNPDVLQGKKGLIYYSADIINADLITNTAMLTGNVNILFNNYELSASNAFISKQDNLLQAWGNVRIKGSSSYIEARKVELNYKTQKGSLFDVRLTSGQILLEAKTLKKTSTYIYEANEAKFTTCLTCPASWTIKGKKIKTNINKYVDIKNGKFQILNQTIFPLPHLILPLNTRRKTGILPPRLGNTSGNSGSELSQPFFWNIDPHRDLTLTPMIYLKSKDFITTGGKLLTEYNQWLGSKSRLYLKSALMYDNAYLNKNNVLDPSSRWFLTYNNFFVLPRGFIQKSQFTLIKERTYLNDFNSEVSGRGEAALKNIFSISKAKGNKFISAQTVYYINLLVHDPSTNDNFSIHKLPELKYSLIETPFLKNIFLFNTDVVYTNFHRNSSSFDEITTNSSNPNNIIKNINTTTNTGQFDTSKDLIKTGHRLRLNAELSAPFKIGNYFNIHPALSYKDSYYHFNVPKSSTVNNSALNPYSQFAFSRYIEFSNSINTEFSRIFFNQIKHKIVPEITFRYGSSIDQSKNIFFDHDINKNNNKKVELPYHRQYQPITDEDFYAFDHAVQFDYWDRFFRANVIEFSLTNIFIKKHRKELKTYYDQPFFFSLKQSYDFKNQQQSSSPDPWSNLDGFLRFKSKHFINFTQTSYFYKAKKSRLFTTNKFIYKPDRYVGIDYSYFIAVDNAGFLTKNKTETVTFSLGWDFPTIQFSAWTRFSLIGDRKQGWGTNFFYTPIGNCWGIGIRLWKLDNDDTIRRDFSFQFNYGPRPEIQKSSLTI